MATGNLVRHIKNPAAVRCRAWATAFKGIAPQGTPVPIVSIKMPSGRIDSVQRFLSDLPTQCGVTLVISPASLAQQNYLALHSPKALRMPCFIAENGMQTRPDSAYIVPVGHEANLSDGTIRLRKADRPANAPEKHTMARLEQDSRQLKASLEAAFQKIAASAEHQRIEDRLRTERDRLTSILDTLVDGVYIANPQLDIEYANPSLKAYFGEPQDRKCYSFFRGRSTACPDCRIEEVFQGNTVEWEWHWTDKVFSMIDTPLRNPDSSISKLGIVRDMTERIRSEQEMRIKDSAIHSAIDAIVFADMDGKITYVNPSALKMSGLKSEDIIGKNMADFGETKQKSARLLQTLKAKNGWIGQSRVMTGNNVILDVQISANLVRDGAGTPVCLMMSLLDITRQKRAEMERERLLGNIADLSQAVTEERDLLQLIMDHASTQLAYLDSNFKFVRVNSAYLKARQHSEKELIGVSYFTINPGNEIQTIFDKVWHTGVSAHFQDTAFLPSVASTGPTTYYDWTLTPVKDRDSGVTGYVVSLTDTTERKLRAEQEQTYERLATIEQLSAHLSSELRNPLATIDSSAYYLRSKLKAEGGNIPTHLERIKTSVERAVHILQNLSNLMHLGNGQLQPLDARKIVTNVIAEAKLPDSIKTNLDLPAQEVKVNADYAQICLAFRNVVDNAVQAMNGAGELSVSIRTVSQTVEIQFSDTGPGIPIQNLDKIFEPLFTTKAKGIGFGLSLSRLVVESHGGTIRAKSASGAGANLLIRLPRYQKEPLPSKS